MTRIATITLVLLSTLLVPLHTRAAPSFDCTKATQMNDKLICQSDELSALDNKLTAMFAETKNSLEGKEVHDFVLDERHWLRENGLECDGVPSDDAKIKCLIERYKQRIVSLGKPFSKNGAKTDTDLVQLDASTDATELCQSVLSTDNIAWHGTTIYGNDLFDIKIPKSVSSPQWEQASEIEASAPVEKSYFDFTNSGKRQTVYKVKQYSDPAGCCGLNSEYYMILDKKEINLLEKALDGDETNNFVLPKKFHKLIFSTHSKENDLESVFYTYYFPGTRSVVYAVESLYTNADTVNTGTEMILFHGAAYFLDRKGMALLRPNAKGAFDKVCFRKTIHSHVEETVTVIDAHFPCPNKQKTPEDPFHGKNMAMITLPEWGGTRPVLKGNDWASRITTNPWVQIGAVGAEKVLREDESEWEALQKLEEDSDDDPMHADLLLSDLGPYIAVYTGYSDDHITTYHRIDSGGLVAACSVEYKRLPPPGIRHASND